ncbi:Fungal specific transcription factor domain [Rhizoctonia solani]|uniref:Fungal specific transcription factor domain n=1 Tax=Rhizoctonia solani TaxID=456999 RepID=A0A8H7IE42_9AGAM|nr:Fungal specific transcription factor domain [Rhizoctonia solani]
MLNHAEISDNLSCASEGVSPSNNNEITMQSSEGTTPSSLPPLPEASLVRGLVDDTTSTVDYNLKPVIQLGSPEELDLGMEQCETLISLEHEHKLLAQFWDWQRMHLPYVAPVPFLSAYAIHSESVHPGEAIPSPPLPPPDAFAATALNVPRASSVQLTSDLAHYISPLLLYSMFAIAALFHGDPETTSVQAVCLMSTWELGHARSPAAWSLIGVSLSLCIRLGLNIDATPLLQSGAISQRLYERHGILCFGLLSTLKGVILLMFARIFIHSQSQILCTDPIESKISIPSNASMTWWSPSTLGMGDVLLQAAWDSIRQLIQMMDDLLDSVYTTEAPRRTAQEILELVTRNHLVVQKFIDSLPTWLRSTGAIKRKDSGLLIHPLNKYTYKSPLSFCTHSAQVPLTRQYRTLAFRIARASALQVSSLIRHIPLSSPCVTVPYIVYSACTVLLLAPEDPAAMDGVRTGLACLDGMDETGYWVDSAEDAARRIRALAERWGVELGTSRRVLASTRPTTSAGSGHEPTSPQLFESGLPGVPTYAVEPSTGAYIPHLGRNEHVLWDDEYSFRNEHVALSEDINLGIDRDSHVFRKAPKATNDTHDAVKQPDAYFHQTPPQYARHHPSITLIGESTKDAAARSICSLARRPSTRHAHSLLALAQHSPSYMGACFHYTVEHSRDPIFVDSLADPYADVSMDWVQDTGSNFSRNGGVPGVLVGGIGEAGGLIRTGW